MTVPVPDKTVDELIGELVAVLAEACLGSKSRRPSKKRLAEIAAEERVVAAARTRAAQAAYRAALARQQAFPVAVHLARVVAINDQAGTDAILHRPRSLDEWREIAVILAGAADPARFAVPSEAA